MRRLALLISLAMMTAFTSQAQTNGHKILVAYFSVSGNTRSVARQIQAATGADLFEIEMVNPYTEEYKPLTERAKKEIAAGYRPELKTRVKNFDRYDVIFIGSPCWWATIAPPAKSFLTGYDFTGKKVVPFMTHGGSGMGNSETDIRKLVPKATVTKGLPVRGSSADDASTDIAAWLKTLNL